MVNETRIVIHNGKEITCEKIISREHIFPTEPGHFYLDRWGIYCKAHAEGTRVVMSFGCTHITGGKVMAKLTSQMLGAEFVVCRQSIGELVVSIDMAQFKDLDKPVKTNYLGQYVRKNKKQ